MADGPDKDAMVAMLPWADDVKVTLMAAHQGETDFTGGRACQFVVGDMTEAVASGSNKATWTAPVADFDPKAAFGAATAGADVVTQTSS